MTDKYLVQVLLPLVDSVAPYSVNPYSQVEEELTAKFKGLTAYKRAPAVGLWQDQGITPQRDDIVIFEVMVEELDAGWWQNYKTALEELFSQKEIVVRVQNVRTV